MQRPVYLILAGQASILTHKTDVYPRRWEPGEHIFTATFALSANLQPGEYTLALWLPDPAGTLRACWMKIGRQKRVPATQSGEKQKRHVFGGYNWKRDTITWTVAETKNSATFITFLEELLLKQHPTGQVVLVMDNVSYHKSASALAALSLFEHGVVLVWLLPYCSDLNPIERFWRHLKDLACANKLQDKGCGHQC